MAGTNYNAEFNNLVDISLTDDFNHATQAECFGDPNVVALDANVYTNGCIMRRTDPLTGNVLYENTGTLSIPSWTLFGTGGGGVPAAPNTSVQFNNAGVFGGSANFTWNDASQILIAGSAATSQLVVDDTANTITLSSNNFLGVKGEVQTSLGGVLLEWTNGPIASGFFADNVGGGRAGILSQNTSWIWPNIDGTLGQQLTTDGAGNLSFAASGGLAIPNTQVVYGTGAGVTSNGNFIFDPVASRFLVGSGVGAVFDLNESTQQVAINVGNNGFIVNDLIGQTALDVNTTSKIVKLGDVDSVGNDTLLTVDDVTKAITLQGIGITNIGDSASLGNDTTISMDDTFGSILLTANFGFSVRDAANNFWYELFPGFHQQTMGDISGAFNNTLFQVDDTVRLINSSAIIAGVGGHAQTNAGGSKIEYVTPGGTWAFNASSSGGGAAIIEANNTNWTWPNTDGNTGDTLVTDGSGILSFDNSSLKTVKVNVSSAEILNLFVTPKILVAAPGAGKCIVVLDVTGRMNFGTLAYATNVDLAVQDSLTGDDLFNDGAIGTGTLLPSVATRIGKLQQTQTGSAIVVSANGSVEITAPIGNPTTGDGTLDVYITYKVITL